MIREEYVRDIRNVLALLVSEVQLSNGLNMQNINIASENFYRDFLNLLFNWNLESSNYTKNNFAGIDLYSDTEKIIIQISSVFSRKKIQESLNKIDTERFAGYHFIFLAIVNSLNSKSLYKEYENNNIHFVPVDDIWDHTKILKFVSNCKIEKMEKLVDFVRKNFDFAGTKKLPHLSAPIPGDIEYFIGREDLLLEIENRINNTSPLYLWGESGVGKTELAIRFANRFSNKVFFVTFNKSIKETIAKLRFVGAEQNADTSIQYRINMELLRIFDCNTILIIDNFDLENNLDPDILRNEKEFIDIINLDLKIIFTTRYNYGVGINVKNLDEDELLSLMFCFYCHKEKSEILKEIIKEVQYNTLVVELCARTLNTLGSISPEQLLVNLQNLRIDGKGYKGIYSEKDRTQSGSYLRRSLIEHIRQLYHLSCLTFEERQILSCASLLPISGIDYNLFVKCFPLLSVYNGSTVLKYKGNFLCVSKGDYKEIFFVTHGNLKDILWILLTRYDDRKGSEEELNINSEEVVDRMIQKGWIQSNENNEIIKLHPILLAAIMTEETVRPNVEKCFDFIKYIFGKVQPENCNIHTLVYAEYGADILRNASERLYLEDNIKKDIREILSNQIFNIAINYDNFGSKLLKENDKKAINYHMIALKLFRQIQPEGRHIAICYDNITDYYNYFEEYELALQYVLNANDIFYTISDLNLGDLKISNHKVGNTYALLQQYEKQKEYYQKNIEIDLKSFPDYHPEFAHDYLYMSLAYHNLHNTEEQVKCLLNAYKILEKIYRKKFRNKFSYPLQNCLFDWVNTLQGLIDTYDELEDEEKVNLFVSKMEEERLKRILLKHNLELKKMENDGVYFTLTTK